MKAACLENDLQLEIGSAVDPPDQLLLLLMASPWRQQVASLNPPAAA
jgi:hypothetical protein